MITHHLSRFSETSQPAVYTASAGTVTAVFWGLHVSDICMILSTLATLCGLALQFYLAMGRIRRLERRQETHIEVTKAVAGAVRVVDKKQKEQANGHGAAEL